MNAFPCSSSRSSIPVRSPSSPSGKGSNALKAETRDAGPSGPYQPEKVGRPFSTHRRAEDCVFKRECTRKARQKEQAGPVGRGGLRERGWGAGGGAGGRARPPRLVAPLPFLFPPSPIGTPPS